MTEHPGQLHFPPIPPGTVPLWIGALGPAAMWGLQMQTVYTMAPWACEYHKLPVVHVVNIIFLILSILCGIVCLFYIRRRPDIPNQSDRIRFLAGLGIFTSVVFSILIFAQTLATFMLDPCAT